MEGPEECGVIYGYFTRFLDFRTRKIYPLVSLVAAGAVTAAGPGTVRKQRAGDLVSDLGDILHAARQKRNLTTEDISRQTHIKQSFIEALESGDYHLLPGPAYITGFLRNYAAAVGLHPDDVVQEYYSSRPPDVPTVKAATRVLANGYEAQNRKRLFQVLGAIVLLVAAAFAIKQYNDTHAQASPNTLNVTPANIGAVPPKPVYVSARTHPFTITLRALAPVWVGVTVDGRRVYGQTLRPRQGARRWIARHNVYVVTYNGANLLLSFNGRIAQPLALSRGLIVRAVTEAGLRPVF